MLFTGPGFLLKTYRTSQSTFTGCMLSAVWAGRRPVMSWSCISASFVKGGFGSLRMRTEGRRRQNPASPLPVMSRWEAPVRACRFSFWMCRCQRTLLTGMSRFWLFFFLSCNICEVLCERNQNQFQYTEATTNPDPDTTSTLALSSPRPRGIILWVPTTWSWKS